MKAAQRRLLGSLAILVVMLAWIVIAATVGSQITGWPWWAQLLFYIVAGVIWIAPLRPIFVWMGKAPPEPDR